MIKKCSHRLLTFFFWFQYFIIVSLILLCVLIFEIMRINFEQFHSIHFKRNFKFSLKDTFLYFEICLINLIGLKEIWRPCWNTIFHIKLNQNIFCSIMPSTLLNYFTMILKISWFITMVDCVSHISLLERTTQCCLKPPQQSTCSQYSSYSPCLLRPVFSHKNQHRLLNLELPKTAEKA